MSSKLQEVAAQFKFRIFNPDAMHIGFTGTRKGMKEPQFKTLGNCLKQLLQTMDEQGHKMFCFHHGDCVGSDFMFHEMLLHFDFFRWATDRIIIHPPEEEKFRAHCKSNWIHDVKPYLARNRDIVDACGQGGLIATPEGKAEELRSGTWSTIRYARKQAMNVLIIYPDGSVDQHVGGLFVP